MMLRAKSLLLLLEGWSSMRYLQGLSEPFPVAADPRSSVNSPNVAAVMPGSYCFSMAFRCASNRWRRRVLRVSATIFSSDGAKWAKVLLSRPWSQPTGCATVPNRTSLGAQRGGTRKSSALARCTQHL